MNDPNPPEQLREVFAEIIAGRSVKRSVHELRWGPRDVTLEFVDALEKSGYRPTTVQEVQVAPGERVPAFFIAEGTAYFGWIFWEKFSMLRLRKLFGSVARNDKGDWRIQIPEQRLSVLYANPSAMGEMDIENPSGF